MNVVIKGGEFNNKGSEAMSLICIYNLIKSIQKVDIYFLNAGLKLIYGSDLKIHYFRMPQWNIDCCFGYISKYQYFFERIKNLIKIFIPGRHYFSKSDYLYGIDVLKKADLVLDISGFALSSKWPKSKSMSYIGWINFIKNLNPKCKIFLMPQSFGPFDFDNRTNTKIISALSMCEKIFVREEGGYNALVNQFGLTNVKLSYDSVLTEKEYLSEKVIANFEKYKEKLVKLSGRKIAIIPNYRLVDRGNNKLEDLISLYEKIISQAKTDVAFYLIPHAGEDIKICKMIKESFAKNDNVILIDYVMASFNYEAFIADFDYIVASRYHSIVHAYRGGTPAIIIGWSEKYDSIARAFNQEKYIYDLKGQDNILSVLSDMEENYKSERLHILEKLPDIQKYDCYEFLKHI